MKITIECEHKMCRHNAGHNVNHDHSSDACLHPFPRLYRYPEGITCKSKEVEPMACKLCKKDESECIGCCHEGYEAKKG